MVKNLRKRHLQIWTTWAALLPAGIIIAWVSIRKPVAGELLQPASSAGLPVKLKSIDKADYTISLLSNEAKDQWQLEWNNRTVLTVPTATIYRVSAGSATINGGELIGRVEARGTYHFVLKDSSVNQLNLVVYDFIHNQIIDTINF